MTVVMLIRHGETDYVKKRRLAGRLAGVHLNKNGIRQAALLAEKLASLPVKAVYSSPLERTMETAQPIAQSLNLELIECPGLIEIDCGEWQDQSLGKLRRMKSWKVVANSPSRFRFPGGETFGSGQLRIANIIHELSQPFEAKDTILCVSHADPIRLAVAFFVGLPLDMFQRLVVSPGSITTLSISEAGSRLLNLNVDNTSPLPGK
jgi:probable phosphoglycerate mutase